MFYKFVGGEPAALARIFDQAVGQGSLKLGAAWAFNDPFEFKFRSIPPPSREAFDAWHRANAPELTPSELANAWASFEGPAAPWNTEFKPRIEALLRFFVLCLGQRWDSHLMWGHYTNAHTGFVIRYKPELRETLRALPDHIGDGEVAYADEPPTFRWFGDELSRDMGALLSTKPTEWAYEREYRFIQSGPAGCPAKYINIDPQLVEGVILGARAPESLLRQVCTLRETRPDLAIEQVTQSGTYALATCRVDENTRRFGQVL